MNKLLLTICAIAAITLAAMIRISFDQKQNRITLQVQLAQTKEALTTTQNALRIRDETYKALAKKVAQLTDVLNQTSVHLDTANQKVQAFEAKATAENKARQEAARQTEETVRLKAAVVAPEVRISTDTAGKEIRTYRFSKLIGAREQVLAASADFGGIYGRRLVFRRENGSPLAFDVDELHPGVLLHLNINAEEAKRAQLEQDKQLEIIEAQHRLDVAARRLAEQRAVELQAKLQLEYAKLEEEKRKAMADEQLKYRAAELDRTKAEASMNSADTAIRQALAPYYPESVIQQFIQNANLQTGKR